MALPEPKQLQRICKVLASLDAVLQPQEWLRYHLYYPSWGSEIQVAKIDKGAGDILFCIFSPAGTVIKGFDHESPLSPHAQEEYEVWPGIYDRLPAALSILLDDPAFAREDVTFCLWQTPGSKIWERGPVQFPPDGDDGSDFLLGTLFPKATKYSDWAKAYYETDIPLESVQQVYETLTLDEETARTIHPQVDYDAIQGELSSLLG